MIYYQDEWVTQYCDDALKVLLELESDSIDLLATDPPYGIGFMGKDWDRALPDKKIWAECLRVLKPGAFAFVMSIPRSDCLSRMIISLEDAGFMVNFTPIFWAYASGFPKAQNIGKAVDKKLGIEREIIGKYQYPDNCNRKVIDSSEFSVVYGDNRGGGSINITAPVSPQAKALDGSYGGFQPKPAVEVIIVCVKPLSEKTFVDQALKNGKGITWLDDGRIPYESENTGRPPRSSPIHNGGQKPIEPLSNPSGRFPANLLVSNDVLNDKENHLGGYRKNPSTNKTTWFGDKTGRHIEGERGYPDSGSFSRYFDLDKWAQKTFPFLIVPKASKSEKNKGLGDIEPEQVTDGRNIPPDYPSQRGQTIRHNIHPTCKPLKLMSYLIILGSRAGDIILDPFGGSGTTAKASKLLNRKCIISEIEEKYCEITANRCRQMVMELR